MKVFISSLISGMEPLRAAARAAVNSLGHAPVMAEDFVASPRSPQVACLSGVRDAAVTVLILGDAYGDRQPSGFSPTEEEFREARATRPVIAFVQSPLSPSADQAAFVKEVQGWSGGLFRGSFTGPEELQAKITRALHEWELSNASGPVDQNQLVQTVLSLMPGDTRRGRSSGRGAQVVVGLAGGPFHAVLRPSEIEEKALKEKLLKEAMFGTHRIFDSRSGSDARLEGVALQISQERGAEISLSPQGSLRMRLPIPDANEDRSFGITAIIQEDVQDILQQALGFAAWLFDEIDPTQRLTHVALAVAIEGASMHPWRSRRQHAASRSHMTVRMNNEEAEPVMLSPPVMPRAALQFDLVRIVEDLTTLLARAYRTE